MKETLAIRFLYQTKFGRCVLKLLVHPFVSRVVGRYLSSGLSRWLIPLFVRKHKISLQGYKKTEYWSFNDFFTRERNAECIDITPDHLISPCDGYVSVYPVDEHMTYKIKHVEYHLEQLLGDSKLAKEFAGGYCLIFRLTPRHYHRYCYICEGVQKETKRIDGKLHCVRPVAYTSLPVYIENSREYAVIQSDIFGKIVQMEIGALLVGKIHNHFCDEKFHRGQEKGYFEFGGSTILILLEKDKVNIEKRILERSMRNQETEIRTGEMVGVVQKEMGCECYE